MKPTLALAAITAAAAPHQGGHTCTDGKWYNPNAGTRGPCPTIGHLRTAAEQVEKLHASVHEAAHDTPAAEHVAQSMTGLVMTELNDEDREGWTRTARMAIEGLAEWLDRDPDLIARRERVRAQLAAHGIGVGEDRG